MATQIDYSFDTYGNLIPYAFISIDDLVDFERIFVSDFDSLVLIEADELKE